jgi:serine/threonine-protein kinase
MPDVLSSEFVALQQAVAGRYSLERELGRGGMGIVFLARDVALDRLVAIKLLPPSQAAQAGLKDRFLREARTSAKLSHPNIVPIYVVEEAAGLVFFVMAFVEGDTLGQRLRAKGPLSPGTGARVLQEVAWALAYAHARGIVHRDVKPDNILIEQGTGRAMVSDFGIARAGETSGSTAVGEILGTAQYMSPEQASGEKVDGRSDIYSLGIVGYYALSGELPFDSPEVPALLAMQITKPAAPLSSVASGVPAKAAQAIDKCLAKDPDDRWPTGEAFAEALAESTAVVREIPAPIRVWITRGQSARPLLYLWSVGLAELAGITLANGASPAIPLGLLAGTWGVFLLNRVYRTLQVFAVGYTVDDLRLALQEQIEHRKEELAFQYDYDREPPWWTKAIRWTTIGALGVSVVSLLSALTNFVDAGRLVWIFTGSTAVALGGAFIGWIWPGKKITKRRDAALEFRLKLMESPLGRFITNLATLGLRTRALPAPDSHRPTELAIGMAADQIFASLPKESRQALRDLPNLVRRLEAEAQGMRARADELNAMIAGLGDEALSAHSTSLRESRAGAMVEDQRTRLRADLIAKREQAAQRLAVSVAALENIRLDLLRLKAGVGTVDQLTADLDAARDLQAEIDLAIESRREVEALLRPARAAAE